MLPTTVPLIATRSGDSVHPQTTVVSVRLPVSDMTGGASAVRLMTPGDTCPPGSAGEVPQLQLPSTAQRTRAARRMDLMPTSMTALILASMT